MPQKLNQLQLGEMKKFYVSHVRLYLRPNGPKSSPKSRNARLQDRVQKCCCYPNCSAYSTSNSNYVCRYTLPLQCSSHQRTKAAKKTKMTSPGKDKQIIREQCTSWIHQRKLLQYGKDNHATITKGWWECVYSLLNIKTCLCKSLVHWVSPFQCFIYSCLHTWYICLLINAGKNKFVGGQNNCSML